MDFKFYLNRQGVRGAKGAKGDKGDSPIISVAKQSANEFVLKVNNPDGTTVESPNLVGQQIEVTASGDIVKYNRDTDAFYTSELDRATSEIEGIVRYATLTDVNNKEGGAVVGTDIFAQAISNVISSPDGSIIVDYNIENEETTLKIGGTLVTDVTDLKGRMTAAEGRIATLSTDMTNQAELLSMEVSRAQAKEGEIENNVTAINNRLTTAESEIVNTQGDVAALDADMDTKQNKLVQGDNITLTENADGTTTIAATGGELPSNIAYVDVENAFNRNQYINGYSLFIQSPSKTDNVNISSSGIGIKKNRKNALWIDSGLFASYYDYYDFYVGSEPSYRIRLAKDLRDSCATLVTYNADRAIYYLRDIDVDGQTIQVVDGKLHANLDEIGGEVSNISSRVTTLEGQVGDISTVLDNINGEVV